MNTAARKLAYVPLLWRGFSRLGARMIAACATALFAAVLLFAAPEVGVAGAVGGIIVGGISAFLFHPHLHSR